MSPWLSPSFILPVFSTVSYLGSPAVAVGSINIDTKLNQKLDNLGVAGTNGVVQSRDALVVRHTRVIHLKDTQ